MQLNEKYKIIFLALLLFSIEFSVRIAGNLTLRKIGLIVAIILYGLKYQFKSIRLSQKTLFLTMLLIGLFLYTELIVKFFSTGEIHASDGIYQAKNVLLMILNIIVFPQLLAPLFSDTLQFAKCQWYVTLIQAVIILVGRIFLRFRMFVFLHFTYGDGRLQDGIMSGVRSVGFTIAGSSGSIILFTGLMCAIYIFFHSTIKEKKKILVEYFIVMVSLMFIGRIGLYFGLSGILLIWIVCILRREPYTKIITRFIACSIIIIGLFIISAPDSFGLQRWMRWVTEILRLFDEQSTITGLRNMTIPKLTLETLFGTGIQYGITASGLILNHDAGYVRMYTAIGLFGCIYFYGTIYGYYLIMASKVTRKINRWIYLLFLFAIAISEMKEPFLSKTPLTMILSCMLMLETRKVVLKSNKLKLSAGCVRQIGET